MSYIRTIIKAVCLTLLLTSCATLEKSTEAKFYDSAYDDQNRAPASFSPPAILTDNQKIDPFFIQTQADYNYSMGEAFSLDGSHQKAIEYFKTTLIYDPKSPTVKLRLATEYLRAGQVSEALEVTQSVINEDPKNEAAQMLIAGLYSSMRLYPKALEHYELVLKQNPENIDASLYLGALYAETQKYDKAIKHFDRLLKTVDEEQKPTIHYYLARVYLENKIKNSSQLVEFHLKKAIELKPAFTEALLTLGSFYNSQNQEQKTVKLFEEYQKKQGPSVKLADVLSQMYLEKEDYDSAYEQLEILEAQGDDVLNTKLKMALILVEKKMYEPATVKLKEILKEVPDSDRARFYLAAIYEQTKQDTKAVSEYQKVPAESNYYSDSVVHAVYILKNNKKFDEAEDFAKTAIEKKADEPTFYSLYASLLNDNKKSAQAAEVLESANSKFPKNTQVLFFMGTVYDTLGDKTKVINAMKTVLENEPMHVQALNYLAYTFAELGKNLDEAEEFARKAAGLEPKDGYILDTLGWVLFKQGKIDDAVKYLEAAHKMAPQVSIISEHLGDVYVKQSMVSKARQMYQNAMQNESEKEKADSLQSKISALEPDSSRRPSSTTAP
jgi:tetratricopeptide (TPR) repeat protein